MDEDELSFPQRPAEPAQQPQQARPEQQEPLQPKEPFLKRNRQVLTIFAGLSGVFLLIIAVLAVLVLFMGGAGVPGNVKEACIVDSGIHCVTWRLFPDGSLRLILANGYTQAIYVDALACLPRGEQAGNRSFRFYRLPVSSGATEEFTVPCRDSTGNALSGVPGDFFDGTLYARYHLEGETDSSRGVAGAIQVYRSSG